MNPFGKQFDSMFQKLLKIFLGERGEKNCIHRKKFSHKDVHFNVIYQKEISNNLNIQQQKNS